MNTRLSAVEPRAAAVVNDGKKFSDYVPHQIGYEVIEAGGRWVALYSGLEHKPGNFFNVLVDDATKRADVLGGK